MPLLFFAAGTIAKNSSKYYSAQQAAYSDDYEDVISDDPYGIPF